MNDRVAIAWLHPGHVSGEFMRSVVQLLAHDTIASSAHVFDGGSFISMGSGPNVASSRNKVVEGFLDTNADWLWFVDSDMNFRANTLDRLLEAADPETRPILGGLCHGIKVYPNGVEEIFPTLYGFLESGESYRLYEYPEDQVVQVGATGAACLLIHRSVLEEMANRPDICPEPHKWFQEVIINGKPYSEDITFCLRARFAGFPTHVHTGVKIDHMKTRQVSDYTYKQWWKNEVTEPGFVVTGTGRSGTGYISKALRILGVNCGHEEWWNPQGRLAARLDGDSTWLAVPHLDNYEGKVGVQVRDPLKVLGSLANGELFGDDPEINQDHSLWGYMEYKLDHSSIEGQTLKDAAQWIVEWSERAEAHADKVWRVEDLDGEMLSSIAKELAGVDVAADAAQQALDLVSTEHNKHPDTLSYAWDDLPDGEPFDELRELARRHGYL